MAQTQTGPSQPSVFQSRTTHHAQPRHIARSGSSSSLAFTQNAALHHLGGQGLQLRSSRTWTSSSGDLGLLSDTDEVEDRAIFVQEYNRLARKHGVRILVVEDFDSEPLGGGLHNPEKRGWLHRMLRSASNNPPPPPKPAIRALPKHKRSVSDLAHNLVHSRREAPKVMDIQEMVRLSGKSALYLPQDYSPCCLVLPTCLRATSQYLAQNATTRGLFRIPGSTRVVNALYDHYCYMDNDGEDISGTVRCVNLPVHIPSSVHDVASTFKRLLSALPGGILGSLALLDAFVAIHSHLHGDPEFPRTKQTKVRARLIALAIGTIKSQFRRELICAVFGLLSLIGRVAEVTPREDQDGRPLPTGDLMGYHALGIVFGPLLMGDMLENYVMKLATPASGLLLFPHTPQKLRRARRKSKEPETAPSGAPTVDKILVAINITEMLISNWRDVVRQMKALGTHIRKNASKPHHNNNFLRPSISESFAISQSQDWEKPRTIWKRGGLSREGSPEAETPTLGVKRQRPRSKKSASSCRSAQKPGFNLLSPTTEESLVNEETVETSCRGRGMDHPQPRAHSSFLPEDEPSVSSLLEKYANANADWESIRLQPKLSHGEDMFLDQQPLEREKIADMKNPRVPLDEIPPRTSSKQTKHHASPGPEQAWSTQQNGDSPRTANGTDRGMSEVGGLQRSRWPNKKTTNNGIASTPTRQGIQTPRASKATTPVHQAESASRLSRITITPSPIPQPQQTALEDDTSEYLLSRKINEIRKNRPYSWEQENTEALPQKLQSLPPKKKSTTSLHNQTHTYEPVGRSIPWGPNSKLPGPGEPGPRDSVPGKFYSPMQVPPDLVGNSGFNGDNPLQRPSNIIIEPKDGRRPSREELLGAASRIARQTKSSNAPLQSSIEYVEAPSTRSWMAQPKVLEAQTRIATQPSYEESAMRPSVSAAASRQGAVKAMAAIFEGQDQAQVASSAPLNKRSIRTQSLASQNTQKSNNKSLRSSKSGPPWTPQTPSRPSWSSQVQPVLRTPSSTSASKRASVTTNPLQPVASDSVALRAAAIMDAERQQQANIEPNFTRPVYKPPVPAKKADVECKFGDESMKNPPSLGTMIPYPEQPPIAHHLNLPRPTSSSSLRTPYEDALGQPIPGATTPIPRPSSTSILHAQIRSLQRQLDSKIDEAAQLRRQVEAQENSDIGTLSEQLREAKREVVMWRERAEAAERRVKVFERFTARLRGIREAAAAADVGGPDETATGGWLERHAPQDEPGPHPHQHVKAKSRGLAKSGSGDDMSDDSGRTEDAGIVTARIRKCLHGGSGKGNDSLSSSGDDDVVGLDGAASLRGARSRDISRSAVEIWIAAQELLYMDDDSLHGVEGFF